MFEGSVLAVAAQAQFGGRHLQLWYAIVTACAIPLAVGGVRVWLEKVNAFLLPIFAVGVVATVVWATIEYGYNSAWLTAEPQTPTPMAGPGWLFVFAIYMGVFSNMLYTFDFARMGRTEATERERPAHLRFHLLLPHDPGQRRRGHLPRAHPAARGGSQRSGTRQQGIVKLMGIFGLIFIVATQTKINTANFYVGLRELRELLLRGAFGLNLSAHGLGVSSSVSFSFAVMIMNIFSFHQRMARLPGNDPRGHGSASRWSSSSSVGAAGRGQDAFEFRPGRVPGVNPAGIIAWIVSSGVGIYLIASNNPHRRAPGLW